MDAREVLALMLNALVPERFRPLGTALFEALARWTVTVAFEMVALRRNGDRIEVFMTLRAPDESYAGQLHTPGSVLRRGEEESDVFARLIEKEFKIPFLQPPRMVGVYSGLGNLDSIFQEKLWIR